MNPFYPKITLRQFGVMLIFGCVGAFIAGVYGVVHDQVTYSIAPEYFTKLKFNQFYYLSRVQPVRILVAEIGFIASSCVGFFAAWFMARIVVPHEPWRRAAKRILAGVFMILAIAVLSATVAERIAPVEANDPRLEGWMEFAGGIGVTNLTAFVKVAYIHNGSYLGALVGLIGTLIWLRYSREK